MCVLFYSSFVCIPAYANVYFKTTIMKQNTKIMLIAGVPSSSLMSWSRLECVVNLSGLPTWVASLWHPRVDIHTCMSTNTHQYLPARK